MQKDVQEIRNRLLAVYHVLREGDQEKAAAKVKELAEKLVKKEFGIAFCGHFSAGKSRMINALLGEDLLPSSPIPTSANLVRVQRGEEYAKVRFFKGRARKYLAPYDYDKIKAYCQDGDRIAAIELSRESIGLPEHVVLMDTPGIDSADDAHRLATESAIHLADLIFYVMDYNHVQSELNFQFTRELTEAGKEVWLVINQIDKHEEAELSFADFRQDIERAFASWGVKPAGIFYTSLREAAHAENEFGRLREFLQQRLRERDGLLLQSLQSSLQGILQGVLQAQKNEHKEPLAGAEEVLSELSAAERESLQREYQEIRAELAALQAENPQEAFRTGIQKILDNAYLMPYETRVLAECYLASCAADFKQGWLFSARKTAAERKRRLQAFHTAVLEKTQAQLTWHLRTFLLDFLQQQRIEDEGLQQEIQAFDVQPAEELLMTAVREGARLTQDGEYVIKYTENVAEAVKNLARQALLDIFRRLQPLCRKRLQQRDEALQQRLAAMGKYVQALSVVTELQQQEEMQRTVFRDLLQGESAGQPDPFALFSFQAEEVELIPGGSNLAAAGECVLERTVQEELPESGAEKTASSSAQVPQKQLLRWADRLQHSADIFHGLPGFEQLASELSAKARRLRRRRFVVTLFGAFSAGKSSFANALLGEKLLPVSPNPTTAAINKILPVDAEHPHGTVLVQLKQPDMLLADVNRALSVYGLAAADLPEACVLAEKGIASGTEHGLQQAFLRAFCAGYAACSKRLGRQLHTDLTEFARYAAQEEHSCFVESIELYYDCEFTRKGIILVDTPGADSVNARHTQTSFSFIRNSDVILFVTYYNHAFSHADREFLVQLGRVKDAFSLDKMFFVVNAIDLAENLQEQQSVVRYVGQQLQRYGVQKPQLYALSSQELLRQKEQGKINGSDFEEAFYHFVLEELAGLAAEAAKHDLERAMDMLQELAVQSRTAAAERQQQQQKLQAQQIKAARILQQQGLSELEKRLEQETQELLYYMKQRVFLRFAEFYRESFNPALLRNGQGRMRGLLRQALQELLQAIGFDFAQEMRAATMRLEKFLRKELDNSRNILEKELREINPRLSFLDWEAVVDLQQDFQPAFQALPEKKTADILSGFHSPKAFFEQGGSRRMEEQLQILLQAEAEPYLSQEAERILQKEREAAKELYAAMVKRLSEQIQEFYTAWQKVLQGGVSAQQLEEALRELQR